MDRSLRLVTRIRRTAAMAMDMTDMLPAPADSLQAHLSRQLGLRALDPRLRGLAEWIVGNLDPHGYLREDLHELAAMVGATTADVEEALAIVQALDPIGVGARSLQECLLLQLGGQPDTDSVAVRLVKDHLASLGECRYDDLARTLDEPLSRIVDAAARIRRLEPRPGRAFGDVAPAVHPDVTIERCGDQYRVVMPDERGPQRYMSRQRWVAAAAATGDARRHLARRLQEAGRLVTALELRRETLRGIAESIVRRQPDFLEHGPERIRPLALRQVADDVGVHESTVSRAVADRYVDTPHGVFPLRSLFTKRLPADPAGVVSSRAARMRICETVKAEDPGRPLHDRQIVRMLERAGVRIARRTVAKYREQLGIGCALARRLSTA